MHGKLGKPLVLAQLNDYGKTKPAGDDKRHNGEVDKRVAHIAGERGKIAHQIKSGVAEGGHAVENPHPDAARTEIGHKAQAKERRAAALNDKGILHSTHAEPDHTLQPVFSEGLGKRHAAAQGNALARCAKQQCCSRHEAKPAKLDEHKDDDLPEQREMRSRVHHNEAGHTGGGRCGKQRIKKTERIPVGSDGQHQQQRSKKGDAQKAQRKDPNGADAFMKPFVF